MNDTSIPPWTVWQALAIAVPLMGGLIVAVVTIHSKRQDDRRATYLTRLDRQLRDLYGPLYALFEIGDKQWRAFLDKHSPAGRPPGFLGFFPSHEASFDQPNGLQLRAFRRWMDAVFMPTNEGMEQAIIAHADLLVGNSMPHVFLEFCVHIAALRAGVAEWHEPDFDASDPLRHVAVFGHPAARLHRLIKASFETLKQEQSRLLESRQQQPAGEGKLARMISDRIEQLERADRGAAVVHTPPTGV